MHKISRATVFTTLLTCTSLLIATTSTSTESLLVSNTRYEIEWNNTVYYLGVDLNEDGEYDGHSSCVNYSLVSTKDMLVIDNPDKAGKLLKEEDIDVEDYMDLDLLEEEDQEGIMDNSLSVFRKEYTYRAITCAHGIPTAKAYPKAKFFILVPKIVNGLILDGEEYIYPAKVLKTNRDLDIAVVEFVSDQPLYVAKLSVAPMHTLDPVFCMGYPGEMGIIITEGRIMHKTEDGKHIVCTSIGFFGCSGGGAFSKTTGQLLGVTAIISAFHVPNSPFLQYLTFANGFIPTTDILPWLMEEKLLPGAK